eukprot:3221071-Pyramimonas_sp.AAC.1
MEDVACAWWVDASLSYRCDNEQVVAEDDEGLVGLSELEMGEEVAWCLLAVPYMCSVDPFVKVWFPQVVGPHLCEECVNRECHGFASLRAHGWMPWHWGVVGEGWGCMGLRLWWKLPSLLMLKASMFSSVSAR